MGRARGPYRLSRIYYTLVLSGMVGVGILIYLWWSFPIITIIILVLTWNHTNCFTPESVVLLGVG